jgi:hypothetical protein
LEKRIAHIISYLTHPLLIPTYGYWILLNANIFLKHTIQPETKNILLITIFINTFVIPFLLILILRKIQVISSIEIQDQKQRRLPFLLTLGIYFACYWLLSRNNLPMLIQYFMLSACLLLLLTYVVNLFWKISAHMVGIGGLCGSIMALGIRFESDIQVIFMVAIICAGLTAFARLTLDAHRPKQVYVGFLLGFIIPYILLTVFL